MIILAVGRRCQGQGILELCFARLRKLLLVAIVLSEELVTGRCLSHSGRSKEKLSALYVLFVSGFDWIGSLREGGRRNRKDRSAASTVQLLKILEAVGRGPRPSMHQHACLPRLNSSTTLASVHLNFNKADASITICSPPETTVLFS